ncbi:MAG: phosphoglycerate dehydrogenase [Leptolinea sp.]
MTDLKKCKVLVTPTSYGKSDPRLFSDLENQVGEVVYNKTGRPLTSAEVREMVKDCDAYLAGLDSIDRSAIESANKLKVISRYGVGFDNVDLVAAKEKGIIVTYTPGANSISVAELTIALILALARNIPEATSATRKGEWPRQNGITLEGKCIGLVGFGAIGKAVGKRLKAFDMRVLAYDPFPDKDFAAKYDIEITTLDLTLKNADFISLHLPLLPETRDIVNSSFLKKMKKDSYIVNTSRGELITGSDLIAAIEQGILRGAALDVFSKEPPGADNPLLQNPNVIVTPHCAAHTDGSTNTMGWMALNDCLAVLIGNDPKFRVV